MLVELLYSSTNCALLIAGAYMISLNTICPTGEELVPLNTTLTLLLSPKMAWPNLSTPVTLKLFVPPASGKAMLQLVKVVQVSGYATPLIQTAATLTGAMPVTYATLLLVVTVELTVKLAAFDKASCAAMLVCACEIQTTMFVSGFSTLKPLLVKTLYLASSKGWLLAGLSGPLTSSCNARQYILRKTDCL